MNRSRRRNKEAKIDGMDLPSKRGRKPSEKKIKKKEKIRCQNILKRLLLKKIKKNENICIYNSIYVTALLFFHLKRSSFKR